MPNITVGKVCVGLAGGRRWLIARVNLTLLSICENSVKVFINDVD